MRAHLQSLQGALSSAEEVLVGEEVILPLVGARKVEHDLDHLCK